MPALVIESVHGFLPEVSAEYRMIQLGAAQSLFLMLEYWNAHSITERARACIAPLGRRHEH